MLCSVIGTAKIAGNGKDTLPLNPHYEARMMRPAIAIIDDFLEISSHNNIDNPTWHHNHLSR